MFSLERNENVVCENCGIQTTQINLAPHKQKYSVEALYCTECPNFSTSSLDNLIYHVAKENSSPKIVVIFKCKLFYEEFSGSQALRQHKKSQHGVQIRSFNKDLGSFSEEVESNELKKELRACENFLIDSEFKKQRYALFKFSMSGFKNSLVIDKLNYVFKELKCAAKINFAF